ncbi:MAG TPA: RlpA-like double-psi beta-barrel domain-containing protein [Candidatus Limnocylindrales bacterium]|nr:RlpA-like double-psi beta-barrel domain-containing protein [Candidatus Limnocylindrales bacterium]
MLAPAPSAAPSLASAADAALRPPPGDPIADFTRATAPRTTRPTPRATAIARVLARVQQFRASSTGHSRSGPATWYCKTGSSPCASGYPGGMYAAAGPGLRIGAWRGRVVRVCGGGSCITVKLIDWCACGNGHLIDLYSDAFRRLAPLSSGAIHVTVSW